MACLRSPSQAVGVAGYRGLTPVPVFISHFPGFPGVGVRSEPLVVTADDLGWQTDGDIFLLIIMKVCHVSPKKRNQLLGSVISDMIA